MKMLLVILRAVFEIMFLGACLIVAFIHKPTWKKLVSWAVLTLPNKERHRK